MLHVQRNLASRCVKNSRCSVINVYLDLSTRSLPAPSHVDRSCSRNSSRGVNNISGCIVAYGRQKSLQQITIELQRLLHDGYEETAGASAFSEIADVCGCSALKVWAALQRSLMVQLVSLVSFMESTLLEVIFHKTYRIMDELISNTVFSSYQSHSRCTTSRNYLEQRKFYFMHCQ